MTIRESSSHINITCLLSPGAKTQWVMSLPVILLYLLIFWRENLSAFITMLTILFKWSISDKNSSKILTFCSFFFFSSNICELLSKNISRGALLALSRCYFKLFTALKQKSLYPWILFILFVLNKVNLSFPQFFFLVILADRKHTFCVLQFSIASYL